MESLNFKKNNLDELFLNLEDNPQNQKNKDFKYVLSLIYELIEGEFSTTYETKNQILRNTEITLFDKETFFLTPPYSFEYFLRSKGSLYRLKTEYVGDKEGYKIPLNLMWDYFNGIDETLEPIFYNETYEFLFEMTQFVKKTVERLNFIPSVKLVKDNFKIIWEFYLKSGDFKKAYEHVLEKSTLDSQTTKDLLNHYLNYLIFDFLSLKIARFKDTKTGIYFTKNIFHKNSMRGVDLAQSIAEWLDEILVGKYDIVPLFKVTKKDDEKFILKIYAKNKKTGETVELDELNEVDCSIIEKQLYWAQKYMEELDSLEFELDLAGVYKIMTKISFYLTRADMEISLPDNLANVIVPRASINAKVKKERTGDLSEILNFANDSALSINEIMNFSVTVALGDVQISLEEYKKIAENAEGLVKYKDKYLLLDKSENEKLFKRFKEPFDINLNKNELLHALLSGKINEYDFDYDEAFSRIISDFVKIEDIEVPENLKGNLRPYQINGFKWLYTNTNKGFGCCMADDMGLGKTVQVISLILKYKNEKKLKKPVLVVCPTTLVGNWAQEIKNFAPDLTYSIYHSQDRTLDLKKDITLTTYAILRLDIEELKKHDWEMIVIDEAQNIKNPDTSQSQAVKSLKTPVKIAMTGTPVENKLSELWSIFDFLNKGYLGSLKEFEKSYSIPIEKLKETSRAKRLQLAISPFMLRRVKTDKSVISDLPEKIILDDYCYLTKSQAAIYERVLEQSMKTITNSSGISRRGNIFKLITALKQICNHPYHYLKYGDMSKEASGKSEKFISIAQSIFDNNEKVLVFTQYKEMGEILTKMVETEFGFKPLFFHGSLNRQSRQNMIDSFSNDINQKIMILSLKAGGLGLNLTSATNVIHYDLWWNPAVEDQATDRTYRIGQDKNVMVHRFITLSTFEEKIDKMIKDKRNLAEMAVFEGEKIITELTDDEIYEIFSLTS